MRLIYYPNITDPYINLAIEEYIVRYVDVFHQDVLFIYRNQSSIVLGKNQNIYQEVYLPYWESPHIPIARRISGGGTVYHDLGNINYAIISSKTAEKINNYGYFVKPIVSFLKTLGLSPYLDERNAIRIGKYKISGSAQFASKKNILSHGTLLFNTNLTLLKKVLQTNGFSIQSKASESIPSLTINIQDLLPEKISIEKFIIQLFAFTKAKKMILSNEDWQTINHLARNKYGQKKWIYDKSPPSTIQDKRISLEIKNGKIISLNIAEKHYSLPVHLRPLFSERYRLYATWPLKSFKHLDFLYDVYRELSGSTSHI